MKRLLLALAIALSLAVVTGAYAHPNERVRQVGTSAVVFGPSKGATRYKHVRHRVVRRFGAKAAGRNIVRQGIRYKWVSKDGKRRHWAVRRARWIEVQTSIEQLSALGRAGTIMAAPPARAPGGVLTPVASAGLPPCTWVPESGGSYTVTNSSSGAYGKYQILPSHWEGRGQCVGLGRDPASQEECARRIWATEGSGAWVNC